jgi:hypothetical protein
VASASGTNQHRRWRAGCETPPSCRGYAVPGLVVTTGKMAADESNSCATWGLVSKNTPSVVRRSGRAAVHLPERAFAGSIGS